jgi:Ca2+/Na+ antiporter
MTREGGSGFVLNVAPPIVGISHLLVFLFFLFHPSADVRVDWLACRAYLVLCLYMGYALAMMKTSKVRYIRMSILLHQLLI